MGQTFVGCVCCVTVVVILQLLHNFVAVVVDIGDNILRVCYKAFVIFSKVLTLMSCLGALLIHISLTAS